MSRAKVVEHVDEASAAGCRLVAFGEALVPGYPFRIERTDGARFDSKSQKEIHSHYFENAVRIEDDLDPVCAAAARGRVAVVLGCIERPADRGGHSLYAGHYARPDVTHLVVDRRRQSTLRFRDEEPS